MPTLGRGGRAAVDRMDLHDERVQLERSARRVLSGRAIRGGVAWNHADARTTRARLGDSRCDPGRGYTIESALDKGALLIFHRRFAEMPERRTKMTQRIAVHGENAAAYVEEIRAAFESNLEPGMRKIAESMAQAASQHPRSAEGA